MSSRCRRCEQPLTVEQILRSGFTIHGLCKTCALWTCIWCDGSQEEHVDYKCLFDSTRWWSHFDAYQQRVVDKLINDGAA